DVHQSGLAGAVMANKTKAFPRLNGEGNAGQGADRAEGTGNTRKFECWPHQRGHESPIGYYRLSSMAWMASAWVYSLLATPPTGVPARASSRVSLVTDRYGTVTSFGTSLPSRICCAIQKARVEIPGAMVPDQVS